MLIFSRTRNSWEEMRLWTGMTDQKVCWSFLGNCGYKWFWFPELEIVWYFHIDGILVWDFLSLWAYMLYIIYTYIYISMQRKWGAIHEFKNAVLGIHSWILKATSSIMSYMWGFMYRCKHKRVCIYQSCIFTAGRK